MRILLGLLCSFCLFAQAPMPYSIGGSGGSVTVVSSGNLTNNAFVTGGGLQTLQTICPTCTLDASGNIVTPGTLNVGAGGTSAGSIACVQGTDTTIPANSFGFGCPVTITNALRLIPPNTSPANSLMLFPAPTANESVFSWLTPATGMTTFWTTPSSANFAAALTDETGTGLVVLNNGPTFIAPILGTPASGIATNITGLPLNTGVTGVLPIANGGTGTASTLTGLIRGNASAMTAAELSGDVATSGSNVTTLLSTYKIRGIPFTIGDPGGSALTVAATTTDYITVPFACTISAYNLLIDAGTITVKFWKVATGTAIPTSGNSISTTGLGISSGTAIHSTTVSDFTTTSVAANDIVAMNVTAVATAKYVQGVLQCNQ